VAGIGAKPTGGEIHPLSAVPLTAAVTGMLVEVMMIGRCRGSETRKLGFYPPDALGISLAPIEGWASREREVGMPGRARWPGGEPRKASQRNTRRARQEPTRIAPVWKSGDAVRWNRRGGTFRRDVGDGEHAEIALVERIYRVRLSELG